MTIKIQLMDGGGHWGQRGKSSKNTISLGKRFDNKILKVQFSLSPEPSQNPS